MRCRSSNPSTCSFSYPSSHFPFCSAGKYENVLMLWSITPVVYSNWTLDHCFLKCLEVITSISSAFWAAWNTCSSEPPLFSLSPWLVDSRGAGMEGSFPVLLHTSPPSVLPYCLLQTIHSEATLFINMPWKDILRNHKIQVKLFW